MIGNLGATAEELDPPCRQSQGRGRFDGEGFGEMDDEDDDEIKAEEDEEEDGQQVPQPIDQTIN